MNRGEIIQSAKDILNWNVTDTVFTALLRRFVDNAYKRTATECPAALVPDEVRARLPGTYTSGSGTAVTSYISTTADAFVLAFTQSGSSSFEPVTDGSWDGQYWLEITQANGEVFRCQCREFWSSGVNRRVSIDRPWTGAAFTDLRYRLYVPYLWMRDDYEEVVIGQRYGSNGSPLTTTNINTAIYNGEWSNQNDKQWGYPSELRREQHYQHPAPNIAPSVVVNTLLINVWGPEPYGEFEYCFTYIWGYRDPSRKSPSGNFIPLFESSPSPVSAAAVVSGLTYTVTLTLPEVAWQLNYGDSGTIRYGKSGWRLRLYRRRVTTAGGLHATIEHPDVFQFLADVEDTAATYVDNGAVVPDYTIRLNDIHGYYAWSMWPLVAGEEWTEYQLRCQRRPEPLLNDSDSPRIVPSCEDALTFFLVSYVARHDKDNATAELYEAKALNIIKTYRARIANPTGIVDRQGWDGPGVRSGWPRARLT